MEEAPLPPAGRGPMGEPSGVWESGGEEMWAGAVLNGDTTWEHLTDWGGGMMQELSVRGRRNPSSSRVGWEL